MRQAHLSLNSQYNLGTPLSDRKYGNAAFHLLGPWHTSTYALSLLHWLQNWLWKETVLVHVTLPWYFQPISTILFLLERGFCFSSDSMSIWSRFVTSKLSMFVVSIWFITRWNDFFKFKCSHYSAILSVNFPLLPHMQIFLRLWAWKFNRLFISARSVSPNN